MVISESTIDMLFRLVTPVVTGIFLWCFQRQQSKKERLSQSRAELHRQESLLILKSIKAIGNLSHATAIAVKNNKVNGEMQSALIYYEQINKELSEFLQAQTANNLHHLD